MDLNVSMANHVMQSATILIAENQESSVNLVFIAKINVVSFTKDAKKYFGVKSTVSVD